MCPVRVISKYGVITKLVGGFNPFEKYARQIGSFPQVGEENKKNLWNHHLENHIGIYWTKWPHFTWTPTSVSWECCEWPTATWKHEKMNGFLWDFAQQKPKNGSFEFYRTTIHM